MQLEPATWAGFQLLFLLHLHATVGSGIDQITFGTCLQGGADWAAGSGVQGDIETPGVPGAVM